MKSESSKMIIWYGLISVLLILILFSINSANVIVSPLDNYGNVEVAIQDQYSKPIDLFLTRFLNNVSLASGVSIGDYDFVVLSGHNISVGNYLCFKENKNFLQAGVIGVSGDNISIGVPFDFAYTTNAYVCNTDRNLNVLGSNANPVIFSVSPVNLVNVSWDVNWMMFHIMDNVVMDDDTFGGLSKLSNGVVVRKRNDEYYNFFNVRYNGDFAHHMKLIEYVDKAPAGLYSFRAYKTFNGMDYNGVSVKLDSEDNDGFEVIVRDDLTSLSTFHVSVHGHVVE